MRLIRPTPGECADRQTILQIKMRVCAQKKIPLQHFVEEHNSIQTYLEKEWFPGLIIKQGKLAGEKYDQMMLDLEKVNQGLWNLEDEIRSIMALSDAHREDKKQRVVEIAFTIPELNDIRARIVGEINQLFEVKTREKVYAA